MGELTKAEKFALMIALMRDLRGSWGHSYERVTKVIELAKELGHEATQRRAEGFLRSVEEEDEDGRLFRIEFEEYGGYEDVKTLLQTKDLENKHYKDVSQNLMLAIHNSCEFPENLVDEYEEWYEEVCCEELAD